MLEGTGHVFWNGVGDGVLGSHPEYDTHTHVLTATV